LALAEASVLLSVASSSPLLCAAASSAALTVPSPLVSSAETLFTSEVAAAPAEDREGMDVMRSPFEKGWTPPVSARLLARGSPPYDRRISICINGLQRISDPSPAGRFAVSSKLLGTGPTGRAAEGRASMDLGADRKQALRREMKARRDALPTGARIEASLAIADHALGALRFEPGTAIGAFLPIGSEVDPRPLMALLQDRGARLALPCIVGGDLVFRELRRGAALVPQGFGTHGPGEDAPELHPPLLLVPLLAFDRRGGRLGYGKGFYDRAIARLERRHGRVETLGLGFAAQEVAEVPMGPADRFLDRIVRESGVLDPSASASG
jgi:5-formyltetrahydrofolate cyclo-ligase